MPPIWRWDFGTGVMRNMEVYEGVAAFPGIAIGIVRYYHNREQPGYPHGILDVKHELARFWSARTQAMRQLKKMCWEYEVLAEQDGAEAKCLQRQFRLLAEPCFSKAVKSMVSEEKVKASYAVEVIRSEMCAAFSCLTDEVVQNRLKDIQEVSNRIVYILDGQARGRQTLEKPLIIAAEHLSPSEVVELDKGRVLGFLTQEGSPVSHASILARAMDVPALIRVPVREDWEGRLCIIDGGTERVYLDPDQAILDKYERWKEEETKERAYFQLLKDAEDVTLDGHRVELYANIGNLEDLGMALENGARGIGLLRSEFQYLGRESYPREDELFQAYQEAARTMGEKLVVIRTLDIGADKKADYMGLADEVNPAMGNRGIRVCLQRKKMFMEQLRAIYRASVYGNLAIMYPMITSVEELSEVRAIVQEVEEGLRAHEIPYREIQQGIVVETPAAVMMAGELAHELDFLSLGTNDLTQYTLAMDRQNPQLKERYQERHPAIMKMIRQVVREGHREGCWVGICGELAADVSLIGEFLRMGVDMLSVVPAYILPVRKMIRETVVTET